jgi:hypothetical protein
VTTTRLHCPHGFGIKGFEAGDGKIRSRMMEAVAGGLAKELVFHGGMANAQVGWTVIVRSGFVRRARE